MDTVQLCSALKNDNIINKSFLGVFPSDRLPSSILRPCSLVANTDPSRLPGSHWVALYIDHDGVGDYFDSYGGTPLPPFAKFLENRCQVWAHNTAMLQGPLSIACGQFCVYYLFLRCHGYTMHEIAATFDQEEDNDSHVTDFVNEYFDINTRSYDENYIINQICKAIQNH